jgi:hypothetical protein
MPLWFVISTVVILGLTTYISRFAYHRWLARQEAEYEGFAGMSEQEQRDFLLALSKKKLTILGYVLMAGTVIIVIGVWYVGGSTFLIARNSDETNETARGLAAVVEQLEQDRIERALTNCLNENANERSDRAAALGDIAAISRFLLRQGATQAVVDDLATDRLSEIPPAEETDRDCDRSGVIGDEGDYPED